MTPRSGVGPILICLCVLCVCVPVCMCVCLCLCVKDDGGSASSQSIRFHCPELEAQVEAVVGKVGLPQLGPNLSAKVRVFLCACVRACGCALGWCEVDLGGLSSYVSRQNQLSSSCNPAKTWKCRSG